MLSRFEYHKAYNNFYNKINNIPNKTKSSITKKQVKYTFFIIFFLFLPFIFTLSLNALLLFNENNAQRIVLNKSEFYNFNWPEYFEDREIILNNNKNFSKQKIASLLFNQKFEELMKYYNNAPKLSNLSKNSNSQLLSKFELPKNIDNRKKEFIQTVLPLAVHQNQKILAQRQRLLEMKDYLILNKTLSNKDQKFLKTLSSQYLIINKNRHKIDTINDLLVSVDLIPNSIVVAQAANESGWGSSRFAKDYNALFGQYTYDSKNGIVPNDREEGKKHLIRHFSSLDKSVDAYFKNINTNVAYDKFRQLRRDIRQKHKTINSELLVKALSVYAEDENYVKTITSIIRDNKLQQYDFIPSI